jgi:hypothetical protein
MILELILVVALILVCIIPFPKSTIDPDVEELLGEIDALNLSNTKTNKAIEDTDKKLQDIKLKNNKFDILLNSSTVVNVSPVARGDLPIPWTPMAICVWFNIEKTLLLEGTTQLIIDKNMCMLKNSFDDHYIIIEYEPTNSIGNVSIIYSNDTLTLTSNKMSKSMTSSLYGIAKTPFGTFCSSPAERIICWRRSTDFISCYAGENICC